MEQHTSYNTYNKFQSYEGDDVTALDIECDLSDGHHKLYDLRIQGVISAAEECRRKSLIDRFTRLQALELSCDSESDKNPSSSWICFNCCLRFCNTLYDTMTPCLYKCVGVTEEECNEHS